MKIIASLSIVLLLFSCNKKDKINHFLTKPITQETLKENGFYKYSYIATSGNHDVIDDTIKSIARYDMDSQIKKNGIVFSQII